AGQKAYEPWERTKTDIQNEIAEIQQDIKNIETTRQNFIAAHPWAEEVHLDNNGTLTNTAWNKVKDKYSLTDNDQSAFMYYCGNISATKQDNYYIAQDQKELKTAPDTVEKKPSVMKFKDVNLGRVAGVEGGRETLSNKDLIVNQLKVWSQKDDGTISEIIGWKQDNGQGSVINYLRKTVSGEFGGSTWYTPPSLIIPQDQAQKLAEQAVAAICPDLSLSASSIQNYTDVSDTGEKTQTPGIYGFNFTRHINGVPITYDSYGGYSYLEQNGNTLKQISYEQITVDVDNEGIMMLEWRAPVNIQITNQNAKVISMDQARQKFEENTNSQLTKAKYAVSNGNSPFQIDSISLDISKIQLGLSRIMDKDGNFALVPSYDFFGEARAYQNAKKKYSTVSGKPKSTIA
ncbi:MAG: DUF6034 family protein, partial [Eubacteriales bacterium]